MKRTLTALFFLLLGTGALAAGPTKREALQAISVLEKDVTSQKATEAAKTIVVFAQASDDVVVDIGPVQLPWVDEDWSVDKDVQQNFKSMLMAAFVAGNIRSQLKNDRIEDDTYSGWIFVIDTYNRLRSKTPFSSPSIEALVKMQQDGSLLQHAKDAHISDDREDPAAPGRKGPA